MEAGVQSARADEKIPHLIDRWGICKTWETHTHTHTHTHTQGGNGKRSRGETDAEDGADAIVTHTVLEIVAPRLTIGK